jgi:hypothetical protein
MKPVTKYYGFYRGQVLQCLNNGFCRIRIPDILEKHNGDVNTLPLAEPAQSLGGGERNGTYMYPELGAIVWCFFEGGNVERPVYFAVSNVKSPQWDDVAIKTHENTNKGNDGETIVPTGVLTKFHKSTITQQTTIDEQTDKILSDHVDITVETTAEQENMYTQAAEDIGTEENGVPASFAACVHLDNEYNSLVLTAKNSIILRAPNIVIDSTGLGQPGYILIKSNETDNLTDNGPYRIMTSKVNIDGGANNIVIQTLGEISLQKNTQMNDYKEHSVEYDKSYEQ